MFKSGRMRRPRLAVIVREAKSTSHSTVWGPANLTFVTGGAPFGAGPWLLEQAAQPARASVVIGPDNDLVAGPDHVTPARSEPSTVANDLVHPAARAERKVADG
jgi:hypothetical protein